MAATIITNTVLTFNTAAGFPTAEAVDASDGAVVIYDKPDHKILLILENAASAEKAATIKAGDALQGTEDLKVTVAGSGKSCICIESGKFIHMTGEHKGKLSLPAKTQTSKYRQSSFLDRLIWETRAPVMEPPLFLRRRRYDLEGDQTYHAAAYFCSKRG